MIEVPSAALTADLIAPEVDFLSLGTNDLTQYTLAADRANEAVSDIFRPHHPAILRLVAKVQEAARAAGKPLAVCGEMAADPALFLLLLGLGIREFSMGPRSVPLLKDVARCASAADASRMARAALSLSTPDDVAALLAREAESPAERRPRDPGGGERMKTTDRIVTKALGERTDLRCQRAIRRQADLDPERRDVVVSVPPA